MSQSSRLLTTSIIVTTLALAACGEKEKPAASSASERAAARAAQASATEKKQKSVTPVAEDKLNLWIKIANRMVSQRMDDALSAFRSNKALLAGKKTDDFNYRSLNLSAGTLAELKKAIEAPGTQPEVDAAGKELMAAYEPLMPIDIELTTYDKTKGVTVDGGAKAKALSADYLRHLTAAIQARDKFDLAMDAAIDNRDTKRLAEIADKDSLEYHRLATVMAGRKTAKEYQNWIEKPKDFTSLSKSLTVLVDANQQFKLQLNKPVAPGKKSVDYSCESASKKIDVFVGQVRDVHEDLSKKRQLMELIQIKAEGVMREYNQAVGDFNNCA